MHEDARLRGRINRSSCSAVVITKSLSPSNRQTIMAYATHSGKSIPVSGHRLTTRLLRGYPCLVSRQRPSVAAVHSRKLRLPPPIRFPVPFELAHPGQPTRGEQPPLDIPLCGVVCLRPAHDLSRCMDARTERAISSARRTAAIHRRSGAFRTSDSLGAGQPDLRPRARWPNRGNGIPPGPRGPASS